MLQYIRHTVAHRRSGDMSSRRTTAVSGDPVAGTCCSPRLVRWLRGSLPVLLWTGYLLVGAAVFQAVEQPEAELRWEQHANLTETTNRTIVLLFKKLLDNMNETMNVSKQDKILTELATSIKMISDETVNITRWDFMNSALFCMTVVSTIGYGFVSPETQLGRGLCIIYALVGIPLNIVVMASVGRALARGTRSVNRILKRTWKRCAFWRKRVGPKTEGSVPPTTRSKREGGNEQRGPPRLRNLSVGREDFPDWGNRESPTSGDQSTTQRERDGNDQGLGVPGSPGPWNGDAPVDELNDQDSPAWLFVFLVLLYTCFFSAVMVLSQPTWTVLDAFYYIIITITTIGFGDLQSSTSSIEESSPLSYYLFGCIAIVIPVLGMILLSAGIAIVVNQFGKKTKAIEDALCGSIKTHG